mgnify:CR=1 FL=1
MGIEQQITEVNEHLERVTIRVRGKKLSVGCGSTTRWRFMAFAPTRFFSSPLTD